MNRRKKNFWNIPRNKKSSGSSKITAPGSTSLAAGGLATMPPTRKGLSTAPATTTAPPPSTPGPGQPATTKGGKGSGKEQLNATLDEHVKGYSTAPGTNHTNYCQKTTDSGPKVPKKGTDGAKMGY